MKQSQVLFAGNILSEHKGTKGVSEKIVTIFSSEMHIGAVSKKANKILRFADILSTCLTYNYKVLIADTYSGTAFTIARLSSIAAKLRGKKIVLVLRGGRLPDFYKENKATVEKVFRRAHHIVTPSLYLHGFFNNLGYKVEYLPNYIDTGIFFERDIQRKPFSLLWVRAFKNIYNPWLAVKTLEKVLKTFPQATLTMVGPDDGLLQETKDLAIELGVFEKITFTGSLNNTELPAYYSSHSVFLNTTAYESFGMAVLEAAACGIPTVSTPVGEIPLLWKADEEIMLTDGFEPDNMATKVEELLSDKQKWERVSQNGKNKANGFSWLQIKSRWLRIFNMDF